MGNVCSCADTTTQLGITCWDRTIKIRRLGENLESLQTKMDELDGVYNDVNQHHVEEARRNGWSLHADADGWLNRVDRYREEVRKMKDEGEQKMGSCCCLRSVFSCNCYALHELSRHAEEKKAELQADLVLGRTLAADKSKVACEPPIMTLERFLEEIGRKKDDLKADFKDVKGRVEEGERQHQIRTNRVDHWMKRVELLVEDADTLLQDGKRSVEDHRRGTGGTASQSDQRTIERAKTLKDNLDQKIIQGREFKEFTHEPEEPVILEVPQEPPVGADSMFEKVWNWVDKDESVRCIGLYRMGGVGKTTLLDRVRNQLARVDHDYNFALRIVVSRPLDLDKIQKDIWTELKLSEEEWMNKRYRDARTNVILNKLKGRNFLLFLDDLWDEINLLKDVGIPWSSRYRHPKKCKIIFTTRNQKVCEKMQPDKKMKVECLPLDEARELFKQNVGVGEEFWETHPGIRKIAEEMVDECKNLPLGIITVARAMSGTTEHRDWMDAKEKLKTQLSRFEDMENEVLEILRFSYERLPGEAHRQCFLYLSIYPEDEVIYEDDAIRLWVGEGFVQEIVRGREVWKKLREASLVEFVENLIKDEPDLVREIREVFVDLGEKVRMHDLVREMAVWVYNKPEGVQKNENKVLVQVGTLQAVELTKWENAERISVWRVPKDSLHRTLSTVPSCRSLSTLIIRGTYRLTAIIPDELFTSMPQLRVLDLENNTSLERLPDSIWKLRELRYLNLRYARLAPVEWRKIEDLNKLEVLILSGVGVIFSMGENTEEAKSSLSSLRIFHGSASSDYQKDNNDEMKLVDVLLMQGMLEEICIKLWTGAGVANLMKSPELHSCLRRMNLFHLDGLGSLEFHTSNSSSGGFRHLESLTLRNCGIEDIKIDDGVSFKGLRHVNIYECGGLKDLTQLIKHAPSLEELAIEQCYEMTKVIDNDGDIEDSHVTIGSRPFFSCLRYLRVDYLPKLESICTRAMQFPSLKEIKVFDCPKLKKLPLDGNSANHTLQAIRGQEWWWDNLEWDDATSKQILSPKFTTSPYY